ncbi:MAG: chorismate mutase, partial [Thermoleophilaceae bacterium]|nr:chorismate mutase [Thermoleophilaceae bacterium]
MSQPTDTQTTSHSADSGPLRLFALRGATTTTENTEVAILEATTELVKEVMSRNQLEPDALVSCIFTCT